MDHHPSSISVETGDALADVLERLRGDHGDAIDLEIPADSSLFLTAAEFRALKDAVDQGRLALTIRTPDPSRLRLARLLGLEAAAAEPLRPQPSPATVMVARPAPGLAVAPTRPRSVPSGADPNPAERAPVAVAASPQPVMVEEPQETDGHHADEAAETEQQAESSISESDAAALWPERAGQSQEVPALSVRRRAIGRLPWLPAWTRAPRSVIAAPDDEAVGAADSAARPERRRQTEGAADAATGPEDDSGAAALGRWVGTAGPRSLPVLAALGLLAVAFLAVGFYLLLPRARVEVVLESEPVAAEVFYDVTANGRPLDAGATIALAARPLTVEVAFTGSIPTTGTRDEPDGTATGTVRLANPSPAEVIVDAGTVVTTEAGVEFAFLEDVPVPAADAGGEPGRAEGTVRAVDPGTVGNVETGTIGGQLPNGVYFSNRDGPSAGGTDRQIAVVAPEDVATLRQRAEAAVPDLAAAAFGEQLGGEGVAIVATLRIDEVREEFDREVGEDGATLAVRAVRTVTALVYDPTDATARTSDALRRLLAEQAPEGFALDDESITVAAAEEIEGAPVGARFRLVAAAEARAILDDAERQELAARLVGQEAAAVGAILDEVPEIERYRVAYRPRWLPDRMPGNAGRIEIDDGQ